MQAAGRACVDKKTKELIPRLRPGDIAVIDHEDIDEVSAQGLIAARVAAVLNAANSVSGRYPNRGPLMLVEAGIPLVDQFGQEIFDRIADGNTVELRGSDIYAAGRLLGRGVLRDAASLRAALSEAQEHFQAAIDAFIENTLEHAYKEKGLFGQVHIPALDVAIRGKPVLVVVRGQDYKDDLHVLQEYIREKRPVLIGVDGGADALVEFGYKPHLIVGDMDSVTDATLRCGAELLVHAYCDGRSPGLARVRRLGLDAKVIRSPGTSEDVALWVAYQMGAELIVAVGTHSNIIDFFEKGRRGMASTFLVRLKVGPILFDAKGVSKLYGGKPKSSPLASLALAAALPFFVVWSLSGPLQQYVSLLWLRLRVLTGW